MTTEDLEKSSTAHTIAEQSALDLITFTKSVKDSAEEDVKVLQTDYNTSKEVSVTATISLDEARRATALAAATYNALLIPPLFDAFLLSEIPADQNIYIPLKTEIDFQLVKLAEFNIALSNEQTALLKLVKRQGEFTTASAQYENAKLLATQLGLIEEILIDEAVIQADLAEKEALLQAQEEELLRLDNLRFSSRRTVNSTKERFFFKFDVESNERFVMEKFIEEDENFFDLYNSEFLRIITSLKQRGEYKVTYDAMRIDLISYHIYGSTQYWWMLLEYNGIIDQFSIKEGDIILFFDLSDLESQYHFIQKEQHKKGA